MIIIDSRSLTNKNINNILGLIQKDLPAKIVVCGTPEIDDFYSDQLKDSGVNFLKSQNNFASIAGLVKEAAASTIPTPIKVLSEDPLTLSLLSHQNVQIFDPLTRKNYSVKDVERSIKVSPEKVIDFFYVVGSKNSNIPQWIPENIDSVSNWLSHGKSIVNLVRDEHSPAKSNPMFEKRLSRGIRALESRQKLFTEIKNFKINSDELMSCQALPSNLSVALDESQSKTSEFSIEKLAQIIEDSKSSGDPVAIFVKENVNPSFLSGKSDSLEMLVSDSKGNSVLINHGVDNRLNRIALDLIGNEIDNNLLVCTNNGKALYKAAFHNKNGSPKYSKMTNVHDVNVMAFSLDNRHQKSSLNKLHSFFRTNDISDQGLALISLYSRINYHFNKPESTFNLKAYMEREQPLVPVLARMEIKGLPLNVKKLDGFYLGLKKERNALVKKMKEHAFDGFSPEKQQDVSKMLYEVLKLPVIDKTKKGNPSTGDDILEKLKEKYDHPFIPLIQEYRKCNALIKSGIESFKNSINPYSNRIHCSFQQTTSQNGRLQTINPNIQGIPSKSERAEELKQSFEAPDGKIFVTMDYQQAEIYVLAALSGCSKLQNVILSGEDIHKATASQIFNCKIDEVTDDQRRSAKAINFGIVYGMSEKGMSQKLGISEKESRKMINKYFDTYPTVKSYLDAVKEGAANTGFVLTKSRRKIYIDALLDKNSSESQKYTALRSAVNAPMQGTAADLVKKAMIRVSDVMNEKEINAEMCIQVHDELVLQCDKSEHEKVKRIVHEIMTEESGLAISPKVDIEVKTSLSKLDIIDDKGGNDDIGKREVTLSSSRASYDMSAG